MDRSGWRTPLWRAKWDSKRPARPGPVAVLSAQALAYPVLEGAYQNGSKGTGLGKTHPHPSLIRPVIGLLAAAIVADDFDQRAGPLRTIHYDGADEADIDGTGAGLLVAIENRLLGELDRVLEALDAVEIQEGFDGDALRALGARSQAQPILGAHRRGPRKYKQQ